MRKSILMLVAVLMVASIALPAFAEVQNVKVSGDLLMQGISRTRFGLSDGRTSATFNSGSGDSTGHGEKEDQNYLQTIARIRLDADLTDGVSATLRTITEREWGVDTKGASAADDLDLDLAYVTLKDALNFITEVKIPLTLIIGSQELHYGSELIVGDGGSSSMSGLTYKDLSLRKSFDAIRAILDYSPLVIDLVAAKADENNLTRYSRDDDDVDLYGINANYTGIENTTLEGYGWARVREEGAISFTAGKETNQEETYVVGARVANTSLKLDDKPLMMSLEGAYQFGNMVADATTFGTTDINNIYGFASDMEFDRSAIALQAVLSYAFADVKYTPSAMFSYTYLSGDEQTGSGTGKTYHSWDPMYENQGNGTIFNALFPASNSHTFQLGGTMKPADDMLLGLDLYIVRLAEHYSASTAASPNYVFFGSQQFATEKSKDFYKEIDAKLVYDYTEDVQLGLCGGVLIPGNAFSDDTYKPQSASQVIGSMKVTF